MPDIHWLETELSRHFSLDDVNTYVDIDGYGKIDDSERTDLNGDGSVDASEWKKFLHANESALNNLGGFFKYYFEYGSAFDVDNPIHDILAIESETASEAQIAGAYRAVEGVLHDAQANMDGDMSAEEKMHVIYDSIEELIGYKVEDYDLLSESIAAGGLDCDESSYIALSVGRQIGLPVQTVELVDHAFVRLEGPDGEDFNMDYGEVRSDADYIRIFNIAKSSIAQGVYLDTNTYGDFLGAVYGNRALTHSLAGENEEALRDFDQAIDLNANFMPLYFNRAQLKVNLGDIEGALADLDRAQSLDPNCALVYFARGYLRYTRGDIDGAIEDYAISAKLDPSNTVVLSGLETLSLLSQGPDGSE